MASKIAPQASQTWHNALKLRKHLLKQLEKIKNTTSSGVDIPQLEAADGTLEKFRLACVQTVFLDFEYAVSENTDEILWGLHTSINSEYRRILSRLKSSSQAVERRKTEKLYINFLRIAQKFYQGYIQRLSARYDIPELQRVAKGIEVEQMTASDLISPVPSELNAKVLRSCHSTLIRLGDLARYRVQAKHKNSGYDMALTYYTLAQHLLPKSGFAFHQMGIVSLDQGSHLDGVYHFYRAWAIKFPHPNAKSNLEMEFRSLQQPASNKSKHASSGPQDAFIMWFVRLHALFYKGEAAPQYKELEREVIHRLEMAATNGSCGDVILKMSFINIAAQYIATIKCSGQYRVHPRRHRHEQLPNIATENKNTTSLQFYQYISNFNIKFLATITTVLEEKLQENMSEAADDETDKTSGIAESLLPALRIYSMWIAVSRQELFAQPAATADGSLTGAMMDTMARVFTLMCVETYNKENLVSCPYLLPEDLDNLGFQPLSETTVPEPCRSFCEQNGKVKPHLYSPEQRLSPQAEKLARILDILRCGYFLAEDSTVPLSCRVVENWLLFEYQPSQHQPEPLVEAPVPILRKETAATSSAIHVQKRRSVHTNPQEHRHDSPNPSSGKQQEVVTVLPKLPTAPPAPANQDGEVGDAESTVINMLAPFLKPPTPQPHPGLREIEPLSSYAAQRNSAAGDLLNTHQRQLDPSPTRSIPSGKFEPLPWEWFNTPKPVRGDNSPLSAAGMSPITPGMPLGRFDDPFSVPSTPSRAAMDISATGSHFPRVYSHGNMRAAAADMGINLSGGSTAEHAHRSALLQSFAAAAATGVRPPSTSATPGARTSPFSHWGGENAAGAGGGGHRHSGLSAPPGLPAPESMPHSSSAGSLSQFSHPSSMYHGTPGPAVANYGIGGHYHFQQQQQQQPLRRLFQADTTTSSYDEAILRAAYEGRN
ncbi:Telomerase activating protein Est1 [Cordyceps militaris CM01]|uniref:Nonsense-mediated mRNA decay factor n=1 Tax=Cordyceps militaris (strain CM01) TaxID=983644 RepID=G3JBD7_CORMM|nr:Telomerase activating protein Est1 [Cordyceps militaris CM01]EGX94444.1 Telomerase activating protein Est1 [Cordyceps militaris CM01]